ncbi:NAD-dependent epimerase/dehydratase family protein [Myxococcota bacterium]|jgi:nucleoside-diphosphate-sugar epimerase|nr:NAD-dependent epimerase/dehydratase family protein [Myxococcota bacterium]
MMGRKVLVTGGAGFIGTSLALRLVRECDCEVVLLDNLHRNALAETPLLDHPAVRLVQGDVLDEAVVREAVAGCTEVVHMAAIAGVDTVMRMPVRTMEVALIGTRNVLRAAFDAGICRRFVDFSTSEVFGRYAYKVTEGDHHELGAVGEARWTYAVSKLATEHLALSYHRQHGFPACSIRPFNIYGPRQVGEGAVHHFIVRALAGEPLTVHNDGAQIRSWCYIDDIVDGILRVLDVPEAVGEAFNIGNPRSTLTIFNLAREVVRLAGSRSEVRMVDWPYVDVELRIPDIGKARRLLGYEPKVDLEEGLTRTIAWYRERRK